MPSSESEEYTLKVEMILRAMDSSLASLAQVLTRDGLTAGQRATGRKHLRALQQWRHRAISATASGDPDLQELKALTNEFSQINDKFLRWLVKYLPPE